MWSASYHVGTTSRFILSARSVHVGPGPPARFEREAKVLASLNHPNIGSIYGLEEADGVRALVLELVEGPTLADRIKQGPIPLDEALPIAKQIVEALEAAHEQGVIHRDLKPANIKVKDDGTVKVLDFGLAKAFQPDASDQGLSASPTISLTAAATQMGMVIGTAAYMAPEQAKGLPVDKRADIWAYGAVLFEMLTGKKLFDAGDVSEMLASVLVKDPDISSIGNDVPAHIRSVVRQCLVKDPKERLRDIGDVRLAMKGTFETTVSAPAEPLVMAGLQFWQRPVTAITAALLLVAIPGLAVWSLTRPAPPRLTRFAVTTSPPPTLTTGSTPAVVFSPDGTQIVYVGPERQLYVRGLDQLEAVPLRGGEEAINPFISPDGNWVGYRDSDNNLKKVSILGGPPLTLTGGLRGISGASWGKDGTIVFAHAADGGLFRVSAAGGDPEPLTMLEEGEQAHRWPEILPGGEAVLFTVVKGSGSADTEIVALNLASGDRTPLIPGGSNPHYAPTGHIVYGVDGTLRAVPFDLSRLAVTGDPRPVLEGQEREYRAPRLSSDGTRLAVTVADENDDVWVSDLASGTLRRLTTDPASDRNPLWTPDGERVVFASTREGSWGLFSMPWDGTDDDAERLLVIDGAQNLDLTAGHPMGRCSLSIAPWRARLRTLGCCPRMGTGRGSRYSTQMLTRWHPRSLPMAMARVFL